MIHIHLHDVFICFELSTILYSKTFGQLAKYTSVMYKSLTPEEKAKWEEAAQQDKARYERELAQYNPPPGFHSVGTLIEPPPAVSKHGKRKKDPKAPKRARGSYVFFTLDERPKIIKEYPEMKFTDIGHAMGERWRALPDEAKAEYEHKANEDKRRFNDEMAQYNASLPPDPQEQAEVASPNVVYAPHPRYQEAQQYAEHYYAQHDAQAAVTANQYDPNAAAYAQYYAQHGYPQPAPAPSPAGYPPQPTEPPEPPASEKEPEYHYA